MWSRGRSNSRGRGMVRGGPWFPRGISRGRGPFPRGGLGMRGSHRGSFRENYRIDELDRSERRSDLVIEKLHEVDVGITEYMSKLEGFTGVLKSRYSDFHVNEIDRDGNIAKLTDLTVPKDPEPVREEEDDDLLVKRYRIEQLPIETWDQIHKMVQSKNKNEIVEIDVTAMTKDDRTKIHEAVKTVFGQKIVGSTVTRDNKKYVVIKLYNKNERVDRREKWPATREGEYLHFLVYKEYTDTIEANIQISEMVQMRPSHFSYAGVKDRRAKTTQWFSARKLEPSRLSERTKYFKNIKTGNYCYKKETLKLGHLKGNRFRLALRNVTVDNQVIETALKSLEETGFINYYGLQRFGNCKEVPTHEIGIQLLKGNWRGAVHLILKPRKHEQCRLIGAAKKVYAETDDVSQALDMLGRKRNKCIEGKLLSGMVKHSKNDFVNSLENIPRNMRLLYIHAYQSYVWNKVVSRRIGELGLKPIVGDIVVEGELEEGLQFLEANEEVSLDNVSHLNALEQAIQERGTLPPKLKVKILTEEDLDKYTIYDIVLPLPGYDIIYPNNVVKDWYEEILKEDGLSLEMPKQKVKTYTLSGAYRKILERVTNFSWKIMRYNDPTANLIRSDYEELMGKPEPNDIPDAKYKALILDFCLSASCYATMVIREVMKMDTSVDTHMNLDNSLKNKSSIATSHPNEQEKNNECDKEEDNNQTIEPTLQSNEDTENLIPDENQDKSCDYVESIEHTVTHINESKEENVKHEVKSESNSPTYEKRKLPDENETDHKKIKMEES